MDSTASIRSIVDAVQRGELRARDQAECALQAITTDGPRLGAFLSVDAEDARRRADLVDQRVAQGEQLALAGVPIAIKDNICVAGQRTTCGSRMLADFVAPYDATVVERLSAAGAVLMGKTNLDEFAMGSSTENSAFFPARNPWAPDRTPGGSSGGSAAAVAAAITPAALGSDTGGSIRQPAAFTGVVGLKPTYGAVSRFGLVAFASSLDQIGPLARRVEDAARILQVIAGQDPRDATASRAPAGDLMADLHGGVRGLRVGLPAEYFTDAIDPAIRERIEATARTLEQHGARLVPTSLPHTAVAIPAYYVVATAEASSNLARYDGVHYGHRASGPTDLAALFARSRGEGFGAEVRRRILLGTFCLSAGYYDAYYERAMKVRTLLARDFARAFESCDLLLTPTTPTAAFPLGAKVQDPVQMYLSDVLTGACNLAGLPGLVVPCGFVQDGPVDLPVGAQLIGPAWSEPTLLRAGQVIEKVLGDPTRLPPAFGGSR